LINIDNMEVWQGRPDQPVLLAAVRVWIEQMRAAFHPCRLVLDPYQMEDIAQTYEQRMPVERFEARGGKANYELAACLRSLIVNQQIAWYPGCGDLPLDGRLDTLVDELCGLVLKQMQYGYRIDHELTRHDDRAVCLGMLAVSCLKQMQPPEWVRPQPLITPVVTPMEQFRFRESGNRILYGVDWRQVGSRGQFRG
jgi:hypothetical protein